MPHEDQYLIMLGKNERNSRAVLSNRVCSLHSHIFTAQVQMEGGQMRVGLSLKH